jgi:hypothetical protein
MTVRLFSTAPFASVHLGEPSGCALPVEALGALQVHDVDLVAPDVLLECGDQFRSFGFLHRDEVLDRHRVHDLAAETLGDDAGGDALARRVDRGGRAGRPAADDEHVEGFLGGQDLRIAPADPVSTLARISSRLMRPWPKGSPLSSTVGTAMTLRCVTSSWNRAPSIMV